jgi:hypothetical protein
MFHSEKLALVAALALIPAASFADTRAGGEMTNGNIIVNNAVDEPTDIWEIIESEAFSLTSSSDMIATACSDLDNPGGAVANQYLYVLAIDDTSPGLNTGSERTVDELYDDPNEDDPDRVAVCTTRFFSNVASGNHTLYVLAAKASAAMADVTVQDTSLTIGAFDGTEL